MDTQLDELTIKAVLNPLSTSLFRLLKAKVLEKKRENWYEIYLACFLILHNSEWVNDHILDFHQRFGVEPEPKANDEDTATQAYFQGCKAVLVYFHFACNGAAPLLLDWDDDGKARDIPTRTPEQIEYLRDIKAELRNQDAQLQDIKNQSMYGTEMYWCHQMLYPEWKADMPHAGKLLEYTEKDFIVS